MVCLAKCCHGMFHMVLRTVGVCERWTVILMVYNAVI